MKQMMKMAVKGFLTKMLLAAAVITVCAYEVYSEELYLPNDGPATTSTIRSIKRLSSSNIAASSFPFSPVPSDILFVTDKNSDNKGQLGEYLGKGTITIPLEINRYFGNKTTLIGHDALPKKVVLEFVTYDIDEDAANPELDYIFFNGKKIGQLHGSDSNYHWMSYLVDIEDVELPKEIGDVGKNTITIQVDVNSGGWKTSIEWISLYIPAPPPVVIAHGINDSAAKNVSLTNAIGSLGLPVHIFDFDNNGFNSIRDGARQLATEVQNAKSRFHVDHVNIVAHSMGGLKAREYTETAHDVLKVLQIATPNAGSPVVDNALRLDIARIANGIISARPAIPDLSVAHMAMYNGDQRHRLNPDVYYRVVAGVVTNGFHNLSNLLYAIGSPYYGASNGIEGDGIVPLWSAHSFVRHYDSSPIRGVENEASHTALVVDNVNYVVNTFLKEDLLSPKQLAATSSSAGMSAPDPSTATLDDAVARLTSSIDLGMIKVGETAVYPFEVVKGNNTSVCVEIGDCEDFDLSLTSPSGKSYSSSTGNVSIKIEGGMAIISLSSPETGTWTASIEPKVSLSGASEVVYLILVDEVDTGIEIDSTLTSDSVHAGEPFTVRVRPTIDGRTIFGTVKGSITHSGATPADDVTTVILSCDGNGVFTGQLPTTIAGQYDIAVSVEATSPVAFKRGTLLTGVATDSATAFTGSVSFAGEDMDGNGLYDSLVALVGVNVTKAGTYRLYATLSDADSNEVIQETWTTNVYCYAGVQNMRIDFSGTKIYAHGQCSGYKLSNARLMEVGDNYDAIVDTITDVTETSDYLFSQFEHATLRIGVGGNDEAVDTDGDNLYDSISVTLPLVAEDSAAEAYRWSATLADVDGQILSRSYGTVTIAADSAAGNMMEMVFPMEEVIDRQIEGSFIVSNILLWNQASGRYIVLDGTYHTAYYPLFKWSFAASDGTSDEAVIVAWKGTSDAATYQIWRSEDDNVENAVQIGTSEGVSYSDATAKPGKTYYYWVRPVVDSQEGEFIGPDSGFAELPAPEGISASSDKTDCVLVKWYPSSYAAKYYVYRSTWRWVDEAELIGECTFSLPPSGSGIGLYYATFTDDTAETGVQYYYWVKAVGEDKASRFSEYAQGVRIPAPVTGVVASDGDFKIGVAVTWNAVEGITEYRVYRSEAEESFSSAVYVASTERCAYYDTEILGGTIYRYWIVATTHGTDGNPGDSDTGWSRGSISGNAPYLVIDLSQGPSAERFPCYEMWSSPGLCGWPREYKTDKLVFRRISPGTFTMGSKSSEKGRRSDDFWRNDESSHDVTIPNAYYIGIFELTIGQDKKIWNCRETSYSGWDEAYPAFYMNYWNARGDLSTSVDWPRSSWVQPLSLMGVLRAKTGIDAIDLPTEAEWEYACRAGTTTALNNGGNLASATANSDANLDMLARYKAGGVDSGVAQVGSFEANSWGLYDMHGNVAEWCLDWYGQTSLGAKILRGGGHADEPRDCRSASRHGFQRKELSANNGVRVAIRGIPADDSADNPVFLVKDGELVACELNGKTEITIPNTVKSIGEDAFYRCYNLKKVTMPNSVTNIGDSAFRNCEGLRKVSLPDSVVSIGDSAFFGCTGLVEVVVGKGLRTIGDWPALVDYGIEYYEKLGGAFDYCPIMAKFTVSSANETFKSVDGMLLTKDGRTLLACPEGKTGRVNVPNGVERIEILAFDECYNLTSITLPDSLTSIGENDWDWMAVCDTSSIPGVRLVDGWAVGSDYPGPSGELNLKGIRGIGDSAFSCCDELTAVVMPEGIRAIGQWTFSECSALAHVTIPDSVTRIGRNAFYGCHDSLYDETSVSGVILVDNWAIGYDEDTSGIIDLGQTRGIASRAFAMSSFKEVLLPERLRRIDDDVFVCASLTNIVIPAGVVYIGKNGLDCPFLKSIVFKGNAPVLADDAFPPSRSRTVYVQRGSTGWNVEIPGTWNGMKIAYVGETPDMIRCTVTFDANGGKPAKQSLTQIATTAWNVGGLQTPTMSGGVFDGWWTAKADGERVDLDGVCSLAGDTTLFARWLKAYKATVKEGVVSTDGTEAAASVSAVNGTKLYLEAKNKSDKNMEFVYWSYTPATVDLGEDFNPRDPFAECFMPEANVAFTANYATKPGYVRVYAYEVNGTANGGGEPEGIEWSADGKFWLHANDDQALPVKSGKMTIKFRSSDPRWTVPASATYVVENDSKVLDIDVAATRVSVVECDVEFEQPGASGTVAMTPKNGQALPGKNVVLTAKPGKDTVFAYWLVNGETACCDASFKYAPDLDSTVTAVFRLKSEVQNPVLDARTVVLPENAMVGVAFKAVVPIAAAARPAKFTASKLPPGLKIDGASGQIVGVPTKAGKYSVEITATGGSNGKAKSSITIPISIAELPAWAVGNFEGFVNEGPTSDIYSDTEVGPATMSVSAAGKVSGKCTLSGTNWTFKADSYAIRSEISETLTNFVVDAVVTAGKVSRTLSLDLQEFPSGVASAVSSVGGSFYEAGGDTPVAKCTMIRIPWTDKGDAKAVNVIASYAGAYTYEVNYGATVCPVMLTLDEKGVIKGAVEIPEGAKTRKVTFSSNALPYLDGLMTFLAVSSDPKKGYLAIFDANFIVNHYDEPMDGFAYRNPGVSASSASFDGAGSGTVTMNPKYGQAAGKTVTLTAKPAKDSVFVKWVYTNGDGEDVSDYSPTLKLVAGECDIPVTALFAAKENVSKPEPHAAAAPEGGVDVWTHAMVGVAFEGAVLVDDAARPASFTAKNLPAGLKIDKTTGVITGRPTKPFDGIVSVTATSGADGKVSGTVEIPMKVHAIPERIRGAFSGFATDFSEETGNPGWIGLVRGLFTATVADNGSIAVKMTTGFGAVSFKTDGWDDVDWDGDRIVCAYATMTGGKGEKLSLSFINGINWDERELDGRVSGGVLGKTELSVLGDRNEFAKVGGKYTHENMSWFADELVGTWDFYVNDWAETWPEVGEPNDDGLIYPYSHYLSTTGKEGASPSVRIVVKGDGTAVVSGEFLGEKISGTIPVIIGWCNAENDAYGVHFWQKMKNGKECYISFDLRSSRESGNVSVGGEAWLRDFR